MQVTSHYLSTLHRDCQCQSSSSSRSAFVTRSFELLATVLKAIGNCFMLLLLIIVADSFFFLFDIARRCFTIRSDTHWGVSCGLTFPTRILTHVAIDGLLFLKLWNNWRFNKCPKSWLESTRIWDWILTLENLPNDSENVIQLDETDTLCHIDSITKFLLAG